MKHACVGLLSKDYMPGAQAFFNSLVKNNPKFNLPFIIFTWENYNFSPLKKIYSNIIFKKINVKPYKDCKYFSPYRDWNYNVFFRLELFKIRNFDYLFYFDFDMLILKDISTIFKTKADFSAVNTLSPGWFNGGVFIVGKKFLNLKTFNNLLKLAKSKSWEGNEALLNKYFYKKISFIDKKFNSITTEEFNLDTSILHFVGEKKPWHQGDLTDKYPFLCFQVNNPIILTKALKLFDCYRELAIT